MDAFWRFAARMTRYRWTLAGSVACAFVAGSGLGAGILGSIPILDAILDKSRTLPEIVQDFRASSSIAARLIPPDLPARLPSGPFEGVVTIMVALGVLTVVAGAANYFQAHLALTAVYRTMTNIRREVFRRVIHMPLASVVSGGTADVVSRLVGDTTQLAAGMAALVSRAVLQIAKGLAGLVAAFVIDWRLAL
ncbi:MAG: hypothetical protein KDA05_09895, partial [Phycisphaerales bacterium]|nr:hypothetical protein [Phycisphaerales bacterium]